MRTQHTAHTLPGFPVYSSAFVSPTDFVVGGGGGQSKTGIKNKLRLYHVEGDKKIELLDELELAKGDDVPMSVATHPRRAEIVAGINSSEDALKTGPNQNCRVFDVKDKKISLSETRSTLTLKGTDDYQKVSVFSPNGDLLAVSGSHDLSVLHYPTLASAANPIHLDESDIYDATFSSETLVVATKSNLLVYSLPSQEKEKVDRPVELELAQTLNRPPLSGKDARSSFRAVRYHPSDSKTLYSVSNSEPSSSRTKSKASTPHGYISKWNVDTWAVTKTRQVSDRGVTCFDVSRDGKLLAFGSSNKTVGILDAQTLAPLLTILKAHDFPPTTLRFSPTSDMLVSGSADNTVRVVTIPPNLGATSWGSWILFIVALLVVLFAVLAQQMPRVLQS
uniref:WD-repeat protein n=1 Tax=Polyporus umbellatus TaxID=158314 RepID=A0A160HL46_9APHY|nr:WD-repeat protein [Polyporus umbellatus]